MSSWLTFRTAGRARSARLSADAHSGPAAGLSRGVRWQRAGPGGVRLPAGV